MRGGALDVVVPVALTRPDAAVALGSLAREEGRAHQAAAGARRPRAGDQFSNFLLASAMNAGRTPPPAAWPGGA